MYVIVIANQKGGVGKTTLSGHLAVEAVRSGQEDVVLIDTDPQGSLSQWWHERKAETPHLAQVEPARLQHQLGLLKQSGVKLVIVDTPPAVTETNREVIALASLVLIPTRPSPHDLRAVGSTIAMAEEAGKKMIFVINGAAQRARITGEAAISLSQHGTVAPVTIYQRTDFASSMIDGRTVQEIDEGGRSAAEIVELWQYVSTQLRKTFGP
jgi:chromosome partitioning protein